MSAIRVKELLDLPEMEPNVSASRVLAMDSTLVVIYDAKGSDWPNGMEWAVIRFDSCITYKGNGPNDEAIGNHPLYGLGLQPYLLQEIIDSPWIHEQAAILNTSGDSSQLRYGQRHFVLAFKEDLLECLAETYSVIGSYQTFRQAFAAASESILLKLDGTEREEE